MLRVRPKAAMAVAGLVLAIAMRSLAAAVPEQAGWVAVTEENDSLSNPFSTSHQDRHYTQGLKLVLFGGDDCLRCFATSLSAALPCWGIQPVAHNLGWVLMGQNIYTPENLHLSTLIKKDRPYAGWLYTGALFQRRGELDPRLAVLETFEVNLGVVGPESDAEESQKSVHRWWFSGDIPQGWDHQLETEPGLVLKYGRLWRYSPTANSARYFDLIPRAGAELGNVQTFATGGAMVRLGWNLPADFGTTLIDSPAAVNGGLTRGAQPFSGYIFGGLDGRAVARDITLDGNSFHNGPSVEKYPFVADVSWGFVFSVGRDFEFGYTHIIRTREFHGQIADDVFGSITVKGKFCF